MPSDEGGLGFTDATSNAGADSAVWANVPLGLAIIRRLAAKAVRMFSLSSPEE